MNYWVSAVMVGMKEILAHKFRSLLTMLGIILGVSSLVAMSALVKGMENGMRDALIAIGGLEKVRIEEEELPTHQAHLIDQATGLTMNDVRALKQSAPLIKLVMPEMRTQRATMTRGGKSFNPFNFIGTWPTALEMNQHVVEHGRMFTDMDDDYAQSVCVIGTMIRDELFGSPEKTGKEIIPIGEKITVSGQPLTIIGMFQHYESEQDRKARLLKLDHQDQSGVARSRGWQSKRGNSFVYRMKNGTI